MQEMQVLLSRVERKGVDGHVALTQPDLQVAALQERRKLSVAVSEIENDRQGVVLLRVRDQEVDEKALPGSGGAQDQRVTDVLHVQVERVRRLVRRLKDGQRVLTEMGADPIALIEGEQKTKVRKVRLQHREPSRVVSAVPRHDAQPGVEQVVRFV